MADALGDRMKSYEMVEAGRFLMPLVPALARIDGRCFSAFTRGMNRPFDERMSVCMAQTTRALVAETGACMGYTQSDEITLTWLSESSKSQIFFNGRVQKMVSALSALATIIFNDLVSVLLTDYRPKRPTFDARVWSVPNETEAANCFLWREQDATKNSISMAAQSVYSHRQLQGKRTGEMQEMLFQAGINWNDYPAFFKRGKYAQKRRIIRPFTTDEFEKLPLKHEARANPDLLVERTEYAIMDMPPLATVINRAAVIFRGEQPRTESETPI